MKRRIYFRDVPVGTTFNMMGIYGDPDKKTYLKIAPVEYADVSCNVSVFNKDEIMSHLFVDDLTEVMADIKAKR